jgi:homoserine dehydrogenase
VTALGQGFVVSGPGAGAEVTAAGILNDIQSLAND